MSRPFVVTTVFLVVGLAAVACAIKLSDPTDPLTNGGVTGPPADCSAIQILPKGMPGTGPAAPKLVGRFVSDDGGGAPEFDWSGTEIATRFQGTEVTIGLESTQSLILSASIDGAGPQQFTLDPARHAPDDGYVLATGLPEGVHEVVVHRDSEALYQRVTFTGFNYGSGTPLPPTERARKIEIIGDSITCGYGDTGANATCPYDIPVDPNDAAAGRIPVSESNYLAYASIAARDLDADLVTICYSGKGVYQNYQDTGGNGAEGPSPGVPAPLPDESATPDQKQAYADDQAEGKTTISQAGTFDAGGANGVPAATHPPYYQRALGSDFNSLWDFSTEAEPQVVVLSVGTNDFARDVNQDSIADGIDLGKFQSAYTDFVRFVRSKRPDAHIFLTLPPMVTDKFPLDNARSDFRNVLNAIASSFAAGGDAKVYYMEFVEMGTRYGLGCDYHPNLTVHQIMAQQLEGAIRTKTCW